MSAHTETAGALTGVKVVDFTALMAGPYCTRMMADLGADVVKVESAVGDNMRTVMPIRDGASAYFGALNAGKRSVVLDLRSESGREAATALVEWADVVVEAFRPGVMRKFGLDYATVSAARPEIVYCSISGYGQHGPWSNRPATAQVVHAASGYDMAQLAFQPDLDRPLGAGVYTADVLGGALAFGGILAALRACETTGVGRHVDQALADGVLSMLANDVVGAQFPEDYLRRGYPPFRTSDGYVMVAAVSQRLFEAMARGMDMADLIEDPRFATNPLRWTNSRALEEIVEEWTMQRTSAECERILLEAGCPASRYNTVADQLHNEQLRGRGTFVEAEDEAGRYDIVNTPFRLSLPGACGDDRASVDSVKRVPGLGADTAAVLHEVLGEEAADRVVARLASGATSGS